MKLLLLALIACNPPPRDCSCKPTGKTSTKIIELARRHVDMAQTNGRDVKLIDDELRVQMSLLCQPCEYVGDRMTVDEMLPLDQLSHATAATCLGLVLDDGRTVTGRGSCR
ncbi:MAG: hypothetical protein QM831_26130 [Kofleriaceae bacterium]